MNHRIRAREVRLIGPEGDQVGIVPIQEALKLADHHNLDLVEVAPNATPPVCRLMDYGKFRYEQSKKEREARKHQKQVELKEVRLRPKTDTHDLQVKAKQARKFLLSGDKVKFTLRFRGREMAHTNIGREMLDQIAESLRDIAVIEQKPTLESRAFSLVLAPNAKTLKSAQQEKREKIRQDKQESKGSAAPRTEPEAKPGDDDHAPDEEELDEGDEIDDDEGDEDEDDEDEDEDDEDDEDEDEDDDKK
ncbi:MAG: translation initiation factor IF-3 [Chloroflexaceae bacterium]|nr:translation initiation factor IF-3 [Chloroflexaceae bacterium]